MAVEPLDLGEEPDVEGVAIENADRVVRIDRGDEPVAGGLDRLEMTRRDEASDAGHGEILHRPSGDRGSAREAIASSRTAATFGAHTRSE